MYMIKAKNYEVNTAFLTFDWLMTLMQLVDLSGTGAPESAPLEYISNMRSTVANSVGQLRDIVGVLIRRCIVHII